MRKIVRTIIEVQGGNGKDIKAHIDTNYKKGIVWWKEKRVAEWVDGCMVLKGEAEAWKGKFNQLMGKE